MSRVIVALLTLTVMASLRASSQPAPASKLASVDLKLPIETGRFSANEAAVSVKADADGTTTRADVKARLKGDVRFARLTKIVFNPARGLVTLSGRVDTKADRAAAGLLVSSVKGVLLIYNELEVERPIH
jgi:osmotically-inducible protein OsmY